MFAVFNAAILPSVWLLFPETKGRSLEELDLVFASANAEGKNPVTQSKKMPHLAGEELDRELLKHFGADEEKTRPVLPS